MSDISALFNKSNQLGQIQDALGRFGAVARNRQDQQYSIDSVRQFNHARVQMLRGWNAFFNDLQQDPDYDGYDQKFLDAQTGIYDSIVGGITNKEAARQFDAEWQINQVNAQQNVDTLKLRRTRAVGARTLLDDLELIATTPPLSGMNDAQRRESLSKRLLDIAETIDLAASVGTIDGATAADFHVRYRDMAEYEYLQREALGRLKARVPVGEIEGWIDSQDDINVNSGERERLKRNIRIEDEAARARAARDWKEDNDEAQAHFLDLTTQNDPAVLAANIAELMKDNYALIQGEDRLEAVGPYSRQWWIGRINDIHSAMQNTITSEEKKLEHRRGLAVSLYAISNNRTIGALERRDKVQQLWLQYPNDIEFIEKSWNAIENFRKDDPIADSINRYIDDHPDIEDGDVERIREQLWTTLGLNEADYSTDELFKIVDNMVDLRNGEINLEFAWHDTEELFDLHRVNPFEKMADAMFNGRLMGLGPLEPVQDYYENYANFSNTKYIFDGQNSGGEAQRYGVVPGSNDINRLGQSTFRILDHAGIEHVATYTTGKKIDNTGWSYETVQDKIKDLRLHVLVNGAWEIAESEHGVMNERFAPLFTKGVRAEDDPTPISADEMAEANDTVAQAIADKVPGAALLAEGVTTEEDVVELAAAITAAEEAVSPDRVLVVPETGEEVDFTPEPDDVDAHQEQLDSGEVVAISEDWQSFVDVAINDNLFDMSHRGNRIISGVGGISEREQKVLDEVERLNQMSREALTRAYGILEAWEEAELMRLTGAMQLGKKISSSSANFLLRVIPKLLGDDEDE